MANKKKTQFLGEDNQGRLTKVTDIRKAKIFSDSAKANNVIKNSLRKTEQNKWFATLLTEVMKQTTQNQKKTLNLEIETVNSSLDKIEQAFKQILEIKNQYIKENELLNKRLSQIDLEITDIYHFIELEKVSVTKWVKIYKLLREKLIERAKIKSEIRTTSVMINIFDKEFNREEIMQSVQSVQYEAYRPRTEIYDKLKSF